MIFSKRNPQTILLLELQSPVWSQKLFLTRPIWDLSTSHHHNFWPTEPISELLGSYTSGFGCLYWICHSIFPHYYLLFTYIHQLNFREISTNPFLSGSISNFISPYILIYWTNLINLGSHSLVWDCVERIYQISPLIILCCDFISIFQFQRNSSCPVFQGDPTTLHLHTFDTMDWFKRFLTGMT